VAGRYLATHWIGPSHEGFEARDATGVVEDGLVIQTELAVFDGSIEVSLVLFAVFACDRHTWGVKAIIVATAAFDLEHGQVALEEQVVSILAILRKAADADAGSNGDLCAQQAERMMETADDGAGSFFDTVWRGGELGNHGDEFVPAEARHEGIRRQVGLDSFRSHQEKVIPSAVAQQIVGVLEAIEIDVQATEAVLGSRFGVGKVLDRFGHFVAEEAPVGQSGEGVVKGVMEEILLLDVPGGQNAEVTKPVTTADEEEYVAENDPSGVLQPSPGLNGVGTEDGVGEKHSA
jgi:hypothetical protein